jgi:hypothetical protein
MNNDIYLDKIKLAEGIVSWEITVIDIFNDLMADLRAKPELLGELKDYPPFNDSWKLAGKLYDFLEFGYKEKLPKEEQKEIEAIMLKYRSLKLMSLENLKTTVTIIRKLMSISKFHDVTRKIDDTSGLDRVENRYKLKHEQY